MKNIDIRRSIRSYEDKKVERNKIEKILRSGMQAPSACNQQPWEFIVVEDKATLVKLSKMHKFSSMIANAGCAIVALGNKECCLASEFWQQDMGACVQNILLEIVEQGLGAVWIGVAPNEERMNFITELFDLPNNLKPFAVIPLGYTTAENKYVERFDSKKIHFDKL